MYGFVPVDAGACKGQKIGPGSLQKEYQATQYAGTQTLQEQHTLTLWALFATLNLFCFRTNPARITFYVSFVPFLALSHSRPGSK